MKTQRPMNIGPYLVEVDGNHCMVSRPDMNSSDPPFHQLQEIKNLVFGCHAVAIQVFPAATDIVTGEHQSHLWLVEKDSVPNLKTGHRVNHES